MLNFFLSLFDTTGFPARWDCGPVWRETPSLGYLHIVSDLAVWGAYLTIPFVLVYFVTRRKDLPFPKIIWLFGAFIFACGTTHLIEALIFGYPIYRFAGVVKAITAIVSWGTVFALIPIAPKVLSMRTPQELEREIEDRKRAERELRDARHQLERRVAERTAELAAANAALLTENAERRRAEERMSRQALEFQLLYRATAVATETESFEQALQFCVDAICEATEWPVGLAYLPTSDGRELAAAGIWHVDKPQRYADWRAAVESRRFAPGEGLPSRVWESGEPVFAREEILSPDDAKMEAFGFPIGRHGKVHAVLEFLTGDAPRPDPQLLELMRNIGDQVGGVLERKQSEQALRRGEERLRLVNRATNDAIWDWDLVTNQVVWNESVRTAFGYAEDQVGDNATWWYEHIHADDRDRVVHGIHEVIDAGGNKWSGEYRFLRADGTSSRIIDRGYLVHDAEGRPVRMIGAMLDITERKRTEEMLAQRARLSALRADVAVALAKSDALPETLRQCTDAIVRHLDVAFARVWVIDRAENVLELQSSSGLYTHLDGPHGRIPMGAFKIGRIAQNRQPHFTNDVLHDPNISDPDWAAREGMVAFAGYPLVVENRAVGVLGLFSRHELAREVFDELAPLADGVAQCIERKRAEQALASQSRLMRTITNNARAALFMMNAKGYCTYMNPAAEAMTGYRFDEITQQPLHDMIHHHRPDGTPYPMAECPIDRALPENFDIRAHEDVFIRKDGTYFPVACAASPVFENGVPVATVVEVRDVTDEKQSQAAMRDAEERMRLAVKAANVGTWDLDPRTGRLQWSDRCKELFGLPPTADVTYETFLTGLHPEDREEADRKVQQALAATADGRFVVEFRTIGLEDGIERWIVSQGRAFFDETGQPVRFIGTVLDITDRKRTEETLRQARVRLEASLFAAEVATWTWDIVNDRIDGDKNLGRLFGVTDADVEGGRLEIYVAAIHPDDRERVVAAIRQAVETGDHLQEEYRVVPPDGNVRWVVARGKVERDESGRALRMPGAIVDITDRKRSEEDLQRVNEELHQKNREMAQFVYIVSHDLKSPLVTLTGFVGLLKEDLEAGRVTDAADSMLRIERATRRMGHLIDDLLELSRVGRVRNDPEIVRVGLILDELREQLAPRLQETGATLIVQDNLPPVLFDRARLMEVFDNLLTNAIKYGCDGPRKQITVSARTTGGKTRFLVRDEGKGIEPQYHEKIFGLFQRLDTSKEGTGVGLAIVRRILEVHGGRVGVDSADGAGATFWIELPEVPPDGARLAPMTPASDSREQP